MDEDGAAREFSGRLAQGSALRGGEPARSLAPAAAMDAALGQTAAGLERQDDVSLAPIVLAAAASDQHRAGGERLSPALLGDSRGGAEPARGALLVAAAEGAVAQRAGMNATQPGRDGAVARGAATTAAGAPEAAEGAAPGLGPKPHMPHGSTAPEERPPAPQGAEGIGAVLASRVPGAAEEAAYGGVDPGRHTTDARELVAQAPVLP